MNQITREDINNVLANDTDAVELVEFRRDGINYYLTLYALSKDDVEDAMDVLEEKYALRIKSLKHDADGYTKIQYTQTENQPKEINMNAVIPAHLNGIVAKAIADGLYVMPVAEGFKPTPKNDQAIKESQVPAKTTPSIQSQIDMLKMLIARLSPEAHAEAVKQGIIRGAQAQFNREVHSIKHVGIDRTKTKGEVQTGNRSNAIGKRQRAEVIKRPCACGCGQMTGGNFAMGHDARAKGRFLRFLRGTQLVSEINWTPSAEEIAYSVANPQWSSEIYEYVMQESKPGRNEKAADTLVNALDTMDQAAYDAAVQAKMDEINKMFPGANVKFGKE